MPRIVTLNVTQQLAPAPLTLQQTGFMISNGGTSLAASTTALITQPSDLTPISSLNGPGVTAATWTSGTATVTTTGGASAVVGHPISLFGMAPDAWNGTYIVTAQTATTVSFAKATNPGTVTTLGKFSLGAGSEVSAMVNTYFAQGTQRATYVFECGAGGQTSAAACTTLSNFLTQNPFQVYTCLVPRDWDGNANFLSLIASDESLTAKTYFLVTTTTTTYTNYTNLMKDVFSMVEAPSIPSTEFTLAAVMQVINRQQPSAASKVTPFCFSFLFGVTPYPQLGNNALMTQLTNANTNFVMTGAEGGISNAMLYPGVAEDGHDFLYWYCVDWVELNIDQSLSNAVINGSNNILNPLYYDQNGINTLLAVAQTTMNNAIAFGLALGPISVTAVPFNTYVSENPSDYKTGVYNGLAVTFTPNRGFKSLTFNAVVTDIPATNSTVVTGS